jgi:hypothetical protein
MAVESRLPPETRDRTDRNDLPLDNEDVFPVRTRVSWSAILAGVALSLAMYFLLSLLGGAVGLSISDKVTAESLSTGAVVFAVVVTCVSLFVGGYVASQLTVGENRVEGVLYGILVWAGTFGMLVYLMSAGVRMGYNAMIGVAGVAANTNQGQWEDAARRAGVPPERIEEWRRTVQTAPADARAAAQDPTNRSSARGCR